MQECPNFPLGLQSFRGRSLIHHQSLLVYKWITGCAAGENKSRCRCVHICLRSHRQIFCCISKVQLFAWLVGFSTLWWSCVPTKVNLVSHQAGWLVGWTPRAQTFPELQPMHQVTGMLTTLHSDLAKVKSHVDICVSNMLVIFFSCCSRII